MNKIQSKKTQLTFFLGEFMKKSILAMATLVGLTSTSASAFDYFFQTGRSMGYGSAGTTYAHWSAAANYNPALIGSAAGTDEDFFISLNLSGRLVEQNDAIDTMDEFTDESEEFDDFADEDLLTGDIAVLNNNIVLAEKLTDSVEKLDGIGFNGGIGVNGGLGMSFDSFAMSFQVNTQVIVGATVNVAEDDIATFRKFTELGQTLLDDVRPDFDKINELQAEFEAQAQIVLDFQEQYETDPLSITQEKIDEAKAAQEAAQTAVDEAEVIANNTKETIVGLGTDYADIFDTDTQSITFDSDDLKSNTRLAAIAWAEAGMTVGSNWQLDSGKVLSIGATFKAVQLEFFDYQASTSGFDNDNIEDDQYRNSESFVTADIGAILALDSADKWRVGVSVKNLNGVTITSNPDGLVAGQEELIFEVKPQVRVGTSYNGGWYRLAADVDVTESKGPHFADGTEFFQGTQYASLGLVLNAWDFVELRAGYRHNLIDADDALAKTAGTEGLVTAGVGLYLGPIQFDLGLQASKEEVGGGLQTMITW
jgi:hypothetical protein